MIDRNLLKRAGWSDELLEAAERASAVVVDPVRVLDLGEQVREDVVAGSQRLELDPSRPAGSVHLHIR
jgi:hypothetical protein